ncbi:class I tRNA ligase family protein [Paraburkholderia sp. BL17N1]|uniref:class I tRNA ligase family protein n=1 Tax=Paraburkholderia sp. BL17N1 TaxID=1938798 RepID=UPI000EB0B7D2|nr:class I tRNA ligase family protein [Paraburkholderia sp. BL17N1]RKR43236.1 methionyl-tRNA synthetase [Paraburkholderia sp. BL17N1]
MWITQMETNELRDAFGIQLESLGERQLACGASVFPSYGVVKAGTQSAHHRHDECEVFVILSGAGEIVSEGKAHPVHAGSLIFIRPFEEHVIRNTGSSDLHFVDLYWRDSAARAQAAKSNAKARLADRPVFVFSTPPTPNGDLHLGHLSGPYLAADVYVRYLRATGVRAYHLSGSDDYQSYVVGRARQERSTPRAVAAHYSSEILATLKMMEIHLDQYTVTDQDEQYAGGLQGFFSALVANGAKEMSTPALVDGESGAYLYEVDVAGDCPTCGEPSGGNICEQCGEPNTCVEFASPRSKLSEKAPLQKPLRRYCVTLDEFKSVVAEHHQRSKVSPRLQELAAKVMKRDHFVIPITHPADWGVPPIERTDGNQVIWVWPEMAYGFLHGIEVLGKRLGEEWRANAPQADWKIVHFFGYDNSFYHSILYPVLYHLAFPQWQCDIDYNENEFYLLDGLKFSTSRRHAIWGKDILRPETVDAVRFYLGWTRGEEGRTNFTMKEFRHAIDTVLIKQWQGWLSSLGARIKDFGNLAPEAGRWTVRHIGYQTALEARLGMISAFYDGNQFSLNNVVTELNSLINDVRRFGTSSERIRQDMSLCDEYRTSVALELATARLLAVVSAPLMPTFASRLAEALGGIDLGRWPDAVEMIDAGTHIALESCTFFQSIAPDLAADSSAATLA